MSVDNNDEHINLILEKIHLIDDDELKSQILKLVEERNNLISISNIDPLTGAYNRRILNRVRDYTVVAICDIDDFKGINDTFGHAAGDHALKLVAQTLIHSSRHNDFVCRIGGDEFVVVFCGASEQVVKKRMNSVLNALLNTTNDKNYSLSLSVGISPYHQGLSLEDVIKEADAALYVSKKAGKNLVTSYRDIKSLNTTKLVFRSQN